jgi:hypothetical protein
VAGTLHDTISAAFGTWHDTLHSWAFVYEDGSNFKLIDVSTFVVFGVCDS